MIWTVRRRIATGYVFSFILLALVAVTGIYALDETATAYEGALEQERATLHEALRGSLEARGAAINHLRYLADPDEGFVVGRDSLLSSATERYEGLRAAAPDAETDRLWADALEALTRWRRASDRAIDARAAGQYERAVGIHNAEALPAYDRHEALVARASSGLLTDGVRAVERAQAEGARWELWLLLAAVAALVLSVLKSVWLDRAVTRPLDRTATSLAAHSAEILEATVQQTWAAERAAQAASRAARRFEDSSDTQAQTLKHVERLTKLTRDAAESNGGREEILRRLREESDRVATLTRQRVSDVYDLQDAVAEAAEAARHSAATAQQIETVARRMNAQGIELLEGTSPRGDGRSSES